MQRRWASPTLPSPSSSSSPRPPSPTPKRTSPCPSVRCALLAFSASPADHPAIPSLPERGGRLGGRTLCRYRQGLQGRRGGRRAGLRPRVHGCQRRESLLHSHILPRKRPDPAPNLLQITARKHQAASSQWCHAKSFDGFCPLGPTLVSKRAIPDPHVLKLKTHVNGNLKQNGSADLMIFPIAQ